ncbi:hypothetical protein OKW50_007645 [Paraburkholderia youngii]|uniref:hypothetical protein n=1 Tax=Paraburkholderia youngii TaxID=2782701 RepID=UPI003D223194
MQSKPTQLRQCERGDATCLTIVRFVKSISADFAGGAEVASVRHNPASKETKLPRPPALHYRETDRSLKPLTDMSGSPPQIAPTPGPDIAKTLCALKFDQAEKISEQVVST